VAAGAGGRRTDPGGTAAYLGHWLNVLREDKRAIFSAAAHAQRAADFLNTLQPQQQEESAARISSYDKGPK
jgi:antirestriction protein ArdC